MKKLWIYLSAILCFLLAFTGCSAEEIVTDGAAILEQQLEAEGWTDDYLDDYLTDDLQGGSEDYYDDLEAEADDNYGDLEDDSEDYYDSDEDFDDKDDDLQIDEDGSYTSRDEVALYIHTYGKLPKNFITKQEAEELGWVSREGNLDEVAPGMSIGGNKFGNYEKQLPEGKYKECDINYSGGYRGDERLVYSEDGAIYYTNDHYASFIQLY